MKVLVKYLNGALKGRVDIWDEWSAQTAQKKGVVEIIKKYEKPVTVRK